MELIFIWYINNSRNKVGYLDFINKEPGGTVSVLDLPINLYRECINYFPNCFPLFYCIYHFLDIE